MKKVQSLLLTGMIAVALVACGGETKTDEANADSTATHAPAETPEVTPEPEPVETPADSTAETTEVVETTENEAEKTH